MADEYWQDSFTGGALAAMGYSPTEIDAYTTADNGRLNSNGTVSSPSWLDSLMGGVTKAGMQALTNATAPKKPVATNNNMMLIIVGVVVLLFGGLLLMRRGK